MILSPKSKRKKIPNSGFFYAYDYEPDYGDEDEWDRLFIAILPDKIV